MTDFQFDNSFIKFDSKGRAYAVIEDDDSDDEDYDFTPVPRHVVRDVVNSGRELINLDSFVDYNFNDPDFHDNHYDKTTDSQEIKDLKFRTENGLTKMANLFKPKGKNDSPRFGRPLPPPPPPQIPSTPQSIKKNLNRDTDVGDGLPAPFLPNPILSPVPPTSTSTTNQQPVTSQQPPPIINEVPISFDSDGKQDVSSQHPDYNDIYNQFLVKFSQHADKFGALRYDRTKPDILVKNFQTLGNHIYDIDDYHEIVSAYYNESFYNTIFHPIMVHRLGTLVNELEAERKTKYQFHEIQNNKFIYVGYDGVDSLQGKLDNKFYITLDYLKSNHIDHYFSIASILEFCEDGKYSSLSDQIATGLIINKFYKNDKRYIILPNPNFVNINMRFKFNEVVFLPLIINSNRGDFYVREYCSLILNEDFPKFIINFSSIDFFIHRHFKKLKFSVPEGKKTTILDYKQDIFSFYNF